MYVPVHLKMFVTNRGCIEGIKNDVEIAVLRQVTGFQYDTVMNVTMHGGTVPV